MIKDLDTRLAILEKSRKNKYIFSENVIDKILSNKVSGIKIKSIFFEKDDISGGNIVISGIAENREILLLFRRTLEKDPSFENVDLPISNFVKGRDIEFNMSLISSSNEK